MTGEQITEICNLMEKTITKELGLRCGHRSQGSQVYKRPGYQTSGAHDFFVDLPTGANGKIRARLFAGYHTSTVSVFGTDFKEMRERIRARECETSNLAIDRFEVPNTSPQGDQAVWCRFKHRGGKNWSGDPEQEVQTLKDFLKWLTAIVVCLEHKQPRNKEGVAMLLPNMENTWKGWDEYRAYWDNFVRGWFECKEREHDPKELPKDPLTKALHRYFADGLNPTAAEKRKLSRNELPEPYAGNPQGAKFVVIQMNPGMSESGEETKYYSNLNSDDAFLIQDFAGCCEMKYSEWIERWSIFRSAYPSVPMYPQGVPTSKVCGHDWWNDDGNHSRWIKDFAECDDLLKCFAIECCPYHSKSFDSKMVMEMGEDYLINRVAVPAAMACLENDLKCVVCLGSEVDSFLRNGLKAKLVQEWQDGWEVNHRTGGRIQIPGWPPPKKPRKNGSPLAKRWYRLYEKMVEGSVCRFLSLYANCMKFPGEDFRAVEARIKRDLARG